MSLPLPFRNELIEEVVERSVSRMQTVVELGRIVRDRNTLPLKVSSFFERHWHYVCARRVSQTVFPPCGTISFLIVQLVYSSNVFLLQSASRYKFRVTLQVNECLHEIFMLPSL